MYPILFHWHHQPVFSYGVAIVIGAAIGGVLAWRLRPAGLFTLVQFLNICLLTTLGAGFGARIFGVVTAGTGHDGGGLSSLGVPLIVGPLVLFYCLLSGLSWRRVFDHLLPFAIFGAAFQRTFGCFLGGCCLGRATVLPWAVQFPGMETSLHPTQLYLGFGLFVAFFLVLRFQPSVAGQKALSGLGLYGLISLAVSPLRDGVGEPWLLGLTGYSWAHGLAALVCLVSAWLLGRDPKPLNNPMTSPSANELRHEV